MSQDRYAVVWTRASGEPVKMASLLVTETQTRITYDPDFLDRQPTAGLSLMAPPSRFGREAVIYPAKDLLPLYPRLMSLIPGRGVHNIQRRLYTRVLENRPHPPMSPFDIDWELLLLAGHNGIGHIDVFADDRAALAWYAQPHEAHLVTGRSRFWDYVRDDVVKALDTMPAEAVMAMLGPTPSVGGMTPKILASIPDAASWDGRFAAPDTASIDGEPTREVLIKFEQSHYEGLLALEALCLDVHDELGFRTPRYRLAEMDGVRMLAIDRFDRTEKKQPVPMETFFSVLAIGRRDVQETMDTDLGAVGRMIEQLGTLVDMNTRQLQRETYDRLLVAILTGNGDLHLENLSFLGGGPEQPVELAPVYDPSPMRAWPQHDLISAIPIDFDPSLSLRENLVELGTRFGFSTSQAEERLEALAKQTTDYPDRVMGLESVPLERRQRLRRIVIEVRKKLALANQPGTSRRR